MSTLLSTRDTYFAENRISSLDTLKRVGDVLPNPSSKFGTQANL